MNSHIPIILAVDDNPANLGLLFKLLDREGFDVLVAQNGESALERAEREQPDFILLDVVMPEVDGFETCKRFKANECTRHIPIMFMTALTDTVDKIKGFELGAVDYITKPIQPEEVLVRIKTHLMIQQLQQDLLSKNEELQTALEREKELNELKSRFISVASHEARTPLTTILLSSKLLKRHHRKMSEEECYDEFDVIEHSVNRITDMLNNVLILSKTGAGKFPFDPQIIDLEPFCQGIVKEFRILSEGTHSITFSAQGEHFLCAADEELLRHILSNLLSNAIKYSPQGGTVSLQLINQDSSQIVSVQDKGIGIPESDLQSLFEAFHRGSNVNKIEGMGLGLSIVKEFVSLHRGTIYVESSTEHGTTFTVTLPQL